MNIKLLILVAVVGLLISGGYFYLNLNEIYSEPSERNYQGELNLGLIPNVPSRVPYPEDKLIGYFQIKNGDTFGLFESNHLETKDYKGIFAYKVN